MHEGAMGEANRPRLLARRRFFEIWFAVLFDAQTRRALWIRYDLLKSPGEERAIVWAAFSDPQMGTGTCAFKRVLPLVAFQPASPELAWGPDCAISDAVWHGSVLTPTGELAWQVRWLGDDARLPPRLPAILGAASLPTHVSDARDRERVSAQIQLNGEQFRIDGRGVQKHIWGRGRVQRLFWLYCPTWQEAIGGLEAVGSSLRPGQPGIGAVAGEVDGRRLTGCRLPQLITTRRSVSPGETLQFEARSLREKIIARASCEVNTLIGYLYRDPSGTDIPVAQSDLGQCTLEIHRRAFPGLAWRKERELHAPQAALEFHGERLPGVRYLEWTEEA